MTTTPPDITHIKVPIPLSVPRARGLQATTKFGTNVKLRINVFERNLIDKQAARLGVTRAHFCRWVSVYAAKELERMEKDSERNTNGEDNSDGGA